MKWYSNLNKKIRLAFLIISWVLVVAVIIIMASIANGETFPWWAAFIIFVVFVPAIILTIFEVRLRSFKSTTQNEPSSNQSASVVGAVTVQKSVSKTDDISDGHHYQRNFFTGKNIVLHGTSSKNTRNEIYGILGKSNSSCLDSVTKYTDAVVNFDYPDESSPKIKRAKELQSQGHHIAILSGDDFYRLIAESVSYYDAFRVFKNGELPAYKKNPPKIFEGLNIAFSGSHYKISAEELKELIPACGGTVKDGISKKVDMFIDFDYPDRPSSKLTKALQLQAEGDDIRILNSEEFIKILIESNLV